MKKIFKISLLPRRKKCENIQLKFAHFFLFSCKTNEKQIFSLFLEFVVLHCLLKRLAKGIAKNHNLSFVSCPSFYLLLVYVFSSDVKDDDDDDDLNPSEGDDFGTHLKEPSERKNS